LFQKNWQSKMYSIFNMLRHKKPARKVQAFCFKSDLTT
jgi:hypothetical protein